MGTNHSHCPKHKRDGHGTSNSLPPGKTIPRGKPTPPSQPMVTEVTHNSVSLSWQPPQRHTGDTVFAYTIEVTTPADLKHWRVVSKCCQGNSYQVRNLEAGFQYLFRVRAENIHGLSKASRPSQVVETKMFGVDQQGFVAAPEDRVGSLPRHQPSISLHLEGSITALLNHTDITVTTNNRDFRRSGKREDEEGDRSSPNSDRGNCDMIDSRRSRSASLQRDLTSRSSLQSDRSTSCLQRDASGRLSLQPDRCKSNSLQRDAHQRSSLQPTRKRSLPILLPGTRTDSLNKLRDSQTFPVTSKRLTDAGDSRGRGPSLRERSVSDVDSSGSGSRENVVKTEAADLKPSKRDSGLEEDAENPWERDDSASEVSEGVVSAHEDRKDSLSPSPPDSTGWLGVSAGTESCQTDFRMLRRVLHSDDVIVKPLSDMGGRRASPHNALSTIVDLEEEEDSVRVTTL